VIIEDHRIAPPRRPVMKSSMETMIEHFKLHTEGFRVPKGEVYAAVEAPKREFGEPPIQMQNPRAVIPTFGGNGFLVTRTYAR